MEYGQFSGRHGVFAKPYIWASHLLTGDHTHYWHQQHSLPFTEVLGFVACRVTSKSLGIGVAERAWKSCKRIKSGQRANIGGDRTKKHTMLHGSACVDMARSRLNKDATDGLLWGDEDAAFLRDLGAEDNADGKC